MDSAGVLTSDLTDDDSSRGPPTDRDRAARPATSRPLVPAGSTDEAPRRSRRLERPSNRRATRATVRRPGVPDARPHGIGGASSARRSLRRGRRFDPASSWCSWDLRYRADCATDDRRGICSDFYDVQARALLDGRLACSIGALGDRRVHRRRPRRTCTSRRSPRSCGCPFFARSPTARRTPDGAVHAARVVRARGHDGGADLERPSARARRRRGEPARGRRRTGSSWRRSRAGRSSCSSPSLPWVYHEVYALGDRVGDRHAGLPCRGPRRPRRRGGASRRSARSGWASILTRTTSGWALSHDRRFGGGVAIRDRPPTPHSGRARAGGGCGTARARDRHRDQLGEVPPSLHVPARAPAWTDMNARRRLALRMNGGTITVRSSSSTSLVNYFRPDGIRFVPYFPFITLPADPAARYGGAFLDQWYRTGSVPAFMPLSSFRRCGASSSAFRLGGALGMRTLRMPLLGAAAVTGRRDVLRLHRPSLHGGVPAGPRARQRGRSCRRVPATGAGAPAAGRHRGRRDDRPRIVRGGGQHGGRRDDGSSDVAGGTVAGLHRPAGARKCADR